MTPFGLLVSAFYIGLRTALDRALLPDSQSLLPHSVDYRLKPGNESPDSGDIRNHRARYRLLTQYEMVLMKRILKSYLLSNKVDRCCSLILNCVLKLNFKSKKCRAASAHNCRSSIHFYEFFKLRALYKYITIIRRDVVSFINFKLEKTS